MAFKPRTFHPQTPTVAPTQVEPSAVIAGSVESNQVIEDGSVVIDTPNVASHVQAAIETYQNELKEAGLDTQQVYAEVCQELNTLDVYSANGIANLGQTSAEKIGEYSDSMLKHVRTGDLEEMGKNLNQVIGLAKNVDITKLVGKDSFVNKLVSRFRNTKEAILSQFNSVSTQLDRIVKEINTQQVRLKERSSQLDVVFEHNIHQYKSLSQSIVIGEARKGLVSEKIALLTAEPDAQTSPLKAQELSDLQANQSRLEKRIHDLKTLQMLALQTAPMIRMVQTNNITLVEKFDNIKTLTIPSWKKQFTLAISMLEQKKSLQLANKIDDATNDLIRSNADLLRQNTLQTAQAHQRSAIDIETLEHVQQTLISTLQDVVEIEKEGVRNRMAADEKMLTMKSELSNFLKNGRGNS